VERAGKQLEVARATAARSASTLAKAADRLAADVAAREAATAALRERTAADAAAVAVQEKLLAARRAPARADAPPPPSKTDAILVRERLKASAREQAAAIRELEAELERLERRNFVKL